jgi:hypothetical protein
MRVSDIIDNAKYLGESDSSAANYEKYKSARQQMEVERDVLVASLMKTGLKHWQAIDKAHEQLNFVAKLQHLNSQFSKDFEKKYAGEKLNLELSKGNMDWGRGDM